MITHISQYNIEERREYSIEYQPPETLTEYSLYGHTETAGAPVRLFAIGGTAPEYSHNWDIYAKADGSLLSIPRPSTGCDGTYFGDKNHIKYLQRKGYWRNTLTEY